MTSPLFASRWSEMPAHAREASDHRLPAGFRAAGAAAGLKPSGDLDVGLLVCDSPEATSAARFTASAVQAPPVLVCRERCRLDALRAVAVNAGVANAATGRRGYEEAGRMQGSAAMVAGVKEDQVAVCSTGVIGVLPDGDRIMRGLLECSRELRRDGAEDLAHAMRTTDRFDKHATLEVELSGGTVRLAAQCKGAGMISPRFATMLCFVETDAVLSAETCDLLLGVCVKRSFDRVSVDGQLSTNDTVTLIASGESGVEVAPESDDERRFGEALDALLRALAIRMTADGEGAARVGRVHVRGGNGEGVEAVARKVATSPLVQTALEGGDPNWGRIAQAVGAALAGNAPLAFDVSIEGVQVCVAGQAVPHDEAALAGAVARDEVEYAVGLPGDGFETEVFFSSLGHEYVRINSEYTT